MIQTAKQKNEAAVSEVIARHGHGLVEWCVKVLKEAGGPPPYSREVALAHEAGHALIGMSLGGAVKSLTVYRDQQGRWGGWTEMGWPGIAPRFVNPVDHPVEAAHALLFKIGGYAGEDVAGLAHPASSPDEVYSCLVTLKAIAGVKKIDAEDLMTLLLTEARKRIVENRQLYTSIRQALAVVNELRPSAVASLVERHGLVQSPIEVLW